MTSVYLDENPHLLAKWSGSNPLGRIGALSRLFAHLDPRRTDLLFAP